MQAAGSKLFFWFALQADTSLTRTFFFRPDFTHYATTPQGYPNFADYTTGGIPASRPRPAPGPPYQRAPPGPPFYDPYQPFRAPSLYREQQPMRYEQQRTTADQHALFYEHQQRMAAEATAAVEARAAAAAVQAE